MLWWILWIPILGLIGWLVGMFNGMVVLKNRVNEAESDVDVQLKRRHDLIPNLISTVQGYATHERELLEKVTQARSNAIAAEGGDIRQKAEAENMLTSTLKSLFAVAENYPDLKASQNFLALQEELSDTENKIMSSRRFYNTNVRDYNIRREMVPTIIFANMFNFGKREQFELEDIKEREVPEVKF
jgi:LemA protein